GLTGLTASGYASLAMKSLTFIPRIALAVVALTSTFVGEQCKLEKYSVVGGDFVRYPILAQTTMAAGEVVVSFDVDSEGALVNVRALSGHPLLQGSTAGMVKSWKLQSDDEAVKSVKNCRVVFNYSILAWKDPGCNELVRPQLLRVSFEGAARV